MTNLSLWSWCCVVMSAAEAPSQPHQRVGSCWHCDLRHRGCHNGVATAWKMRVRKTVFKEWGYSGYPRGTVFICWVHVMHVSSHSATYSLLGKRTVLPHPALHAHSGIFYRVLAHWLISPLLGYLGCGFGVCLFFFLKSYQKENLSLWPWR